MGAAICFKKKKMKGGNRECTAGLFFVFDVLSRGSEKTPLTKNNLKIFKHMNAYFHV